MEFGVQRAMLLEHRNFALEAKTNNSTKTKEELNKHTRQEQKKKIQINKHSTKLNNIK